MSGKIPSKIGRYSAELSAEYSAVFGRIFGIGRYQFLPYRSYTNYDILDIVGFFKNDYLGIDFEL